MVERSASSPEEITDSTVPHKRIRNFFMRLVRFGNREQQPVPIDSEQLSQLRDGVDRLEEAIEGSPNRVPSLPYKDKKDVTYFGSGVALGLHIDEASVLQPEVRIEVATGYPGRTTLVTRSSRYRDDLMVREVHAFNLDNNFSYRQNTQLVQLGEGNEARTDDLQAIEIDQDLRQGSVPELLGTLQTLHREVQDFALSTHTG